jgi:TP901 family phage tail tape measure protein
MAELGFNVLDMNGNLRDMGEVMEEIGNKWSSLTREQQVSLAQTMAGQRQYSNLIALFDNFEKYNEALATAQGAAGTLQEQQDVYMDQTAAHLQVLKASMEDIYDSLADTDSINSIIDVLSGAANFAANFIDSLGGGIPILQSLGSIGLTVFS